MNDHRSSASGRARSGVPVVVVVLMASAAAGFAAYRLLGRPSSHHPVEVAQGPASPAPLGTVEAEVAPPTSPAPRVPERLPELRLPGVDGVVHGLGDWKGRPLLVNFWATWCEPCRREIPLLKKLRREHAADGLEIVGIAVDYPDEVRQYAATHGIDYPVLIGESGGLAAANAFGMDPVLPFSVFTDRSGTVVTLRVGELHRDEAELILDRIRDVDTGTLSVSTAREQISDGVRRLRRVQSAPK